MYSLLPLRGSNDPPGGRYTEYPDIRVGVQRAEGKGGDESAFGPASVTLRSSDGFVYAGYQPRDLCCGSLEQVLALGSRVGVQGVVYAGYQPRVLCCRCVRVGGLGVSGFGVFIHQPRNHC